MTNAKYRQAFEQAKADLSEAQRRKEKAVADGKKADDDIMTLRRGVTILATLCGENVEDSMGLTAAVRTVIGKGWLTFPQIKDQVEQIGVSLDGLKNPEASVMSVLNRLVASKELLQMNAKIQGDKSGKEVKVWRKNPDPPKPEPVTELTDDDIPF